MFSIEFDLVGEYIDALKTDIIVGREAMSRELMDIVLDAADAAVLEMQLNHPYTDRTQMLSGGMQVKPGRESRYTASATIVFLAKYAKFVNDGTVRSRAYPFIPQGMDAAQRVLDARGAGALGVFLEYTAKR